MKHKFLSLFIAIVAMTILYSPTFASVTINGIAYELKGTTATVVSGGDYTGTIVIPASVTYSGTTYRVTSIGDGAFFDCTGLTSVTIPNSVTSIGGSAFQYCGGLTSVTIPNSIRGIGRQAFWSCTGLTSVTIPDSVTWIGESAFHYCTGLTSITINSNAIVSNNAEFKDIFGKKKKKYIIGNSVTSIGDYTFCNCSSLTSVTIPNSVTSIGRSAFSGCKGLTSIEIPNSVISIGDRAFGGCSGLTGELVIPNSVTSIGNNSFGSCSGVTSVTIPNSVTSIGGSAFSYCSGLTSVTIPNSVTSIGGSAFSGCSGLTSVTIEAETPPTLGANAFNNTSNCPIYVPCGTLEAYQSAWSDYVFQIKYAPLLYKILSQSENGSIDIRSLEDYTICDGQPYFSLMVIPDYGYHFTQWSDGNTENPRTILLTQDTTFIAEIEKNSYTISTQSANPEWGTTVGDTAALYLDEIEISAAPNYGYHFVKWDIEKYRELIDISSPYTVKFSVPNTWSDPYAWIWKTGGQGHWETLSYEKSMYVYRTEQNNMNIIVVPNGPSWGNGQTNDLAITESCCYTIRGFKVVKSYDLQIDTITTLETHNPLSIIVASNQNATAKFAKNTYSITTNAEHGTISGNSSAEYLDQVTLSVSSDYGYHFTQWSDGNTENPRTFVLTQDTTFTSEFAVDKSGTCGKNNLLQWTFADDGTLAISGSGELTENYTFGVEAPTQMQQLVVGNEVTAIGERAFYEKNTLQKLIIGSNVTSIGKYAFASINNRQLTSLVMPAELLTIGDYAFSGNTYLESIDFNAKLQSIGAYAFKDCYRVSEMTCLATVTPNVGTDALASINSYASLCVPAECLRKYQVDPNWGRFDLCELGTTSTVTENRTVTVEPTDNTAIFTWPTENNAASYSLQITKDGVVFCTLVFNSNGQLTGIAFAPGRNGAAHAPAATTSVAGMSFTVTGLDGASKYAYRLAVTNDASEELVAYSGEFATTGYDGEVNPGGNPEGIEDVFTDEHKASKILRDGQIFILRGEKVYTLTGQEVR